ncbi:MAG: hypothetical protein JO166_03700 [Deltaproteobacteria bacterium]|nr:hypothetical protein [Deltaproteobacteria bacterium]
MNAGIRDPADYGPHEQMETLRRVARRAIAGPLSGLSTGKLLACLPEPPGRTCGMPATHGMRAPVAHDHASRRGRL